MKGSMVTNARGRHLKEMTKALRMAEPLAVSYKRRLSGRLQYIICDDNGPQFLIRWNPDNFAHLCGLRFHAPFVLQKTRNGRSDAEMLLDLLCNGLDSFTPKMLDGIAANLDWSDNHGYFQDKIRTLPILLQDPLDMTNVVLTTHLLMIKYVGQAEYRIGLSPLTRTPSPITGIDWYFPRSFRKGPPEREAYRDRSKPVYTVKTTYLI
ncbi:hypothetical protein [Bifidobacterium sp. SO1]|uniref:hypothetical protein n=1 Tax=Bifidobacterium sp. SO1 TaxID=2809029 RepID=UPI001BDDB97F|nr:hypothetical protein [Bifidobacterium sp. SO1]MBT1162896.1 hypothetical protein [Bifidobacterium sp. SO1]